MTWHEPSLASKLPHSTPRDSYKVGNFNNKKAKTMHNRISVNSICFMGSSFSQQADYWQQLAPHRVSILGGQVDQEGLDAARQALATGSYRLENIMQPFLPGQNLNPDNSSWEAPRARLNAQIDNAIALGANSIYMVTGGHGGMVWEQAAEVFAEAVAPCVAKAKAAGIALMIENAPFHNADIHIAHSLRDTITLAEMAGTGICIDLFGCWYEAGLRGLIERAMPRCQLVQVSDYVCGDRAPAARAVPGDGHVPLLRLLEWILAAGYQGAFDLELFGPRIEQEGRLEATRRTCERLSEMLVALGV